MNNFTKEELMNIADAILYSGLFETRKDTLIPIRDKLKSLIDNYCEHEHTWNRLTMLSGKDYDFCEGCMSVRRIR
jgi:hypothetical protein